MANNQPLSVRRKTAQERSMFEAKKDCFQVAARRKIITAKQRVKPTEKTRNLSNNSMREK